LRGPGGGRPGRPALDAFFFRVDNRIETARIGMAAPSRDAKRLAKLLCEKLETVDPGFGVDRMVLAAPGAEPLAYKPGRGGVGAQGPGGETDHAGLIDTLSNRLGPSTSIA
jgi:protein ImuB